MIREKLTENILKLTDLERAFLETLTQKDVDWFLDEKNKDAEVAKKLTSSFNPHYDKSGYMDLWYKVTNGINMEVLFSQTDLYGARYKSLAEQINDLYASNSRKNVITILKAFAVRDFDDLVDKHFIDVTLDEFLDTFEKWGMELVINNLDEEDLITIIYFCGGIVRYVKEYNLPKVSEIIL